MSSSNLEVMNLLLNSWPTFPSPETGVAETVVAESAVLPPLVVPVPGVVAGNNAEGGPPTLALATAGGPPAVAAAGGRPPLSPVMLPKRVARSSEAAEGAAVPSD